MYRRVIFFYLNCLVEETCKKELAMQKEIEDKDKEILIYLETIEQGKKERLELKNQLKKQKREGRLGKREGSLGEENS